MRQPNQYPMNCIIAKCIANKTMHFTMQFTMRSTGRNRPQETLVGAISAHRCESLQRTGTLGTKQNQPSHAIAHASLFSEQKPIKFQQNRQSSRVSVDIVCAWVSLSNRFRIRARVRSCVNRPDGNTNWPADRPHTHHIDRTDANRAIYR